METEILLDSPDLPAVLADDSRCVDRIAYLWNAADVLPHYPVSTETVSELLRAGGGYDASVELLEQWARNRTVEGVGNRGGQFVWSARAIIGAMLLCDSWRRFMPMDRRHIHKLSAAELIEAQARLAGETGFEDLAVFDCNAICELLARCNDADMRRTFATAMKAKLRQLGVLDQ